MKAFICRWLFLRHWVYYTRCSDVVISVLDEIGFSEVFSVNLKDIVFIWETVARWAVRVHDPLKSLVIRNQIN